MTSRNRLIAITASGLAVLALVAVFLSTRGGADFPGPGSGNAVVIVVRGDSLSGIANTLVEAGVIASDKAFLEAAAGDSKSKTIGPGRYTMLQEMSGAGALALMLDPKSRAESRLVLPEGLRLAQSIGTASQATGVAKDAFGAALASPAGLGMPAWAKDRPEGLLFPASYDLAGDETAPIVLRMLFKRFNQESQDLKLVPRAAAQGRDPYSIMIIASLVQAEGNPRDYSRIARVIQNRLAAGMPLQLDTTVAYGLDITRVSLTAEQLKTDTPYNTYLHAGLPPTPINSPGAAAIEAALSPAQGKWRYFVTVDLETGETRFARNYQKFLRDKAVLQAYLNAHG